MKKERNSRKREDPLYSFWGFFIWYCFMNDNKPNNIETKTENKKRRGSRSSKKKNIHDHNKPSRTRVLALTGLMAAISALLMQFQISIPIVPNFLKLDISEFPALIAGYAYGPMAGIWVCLVKNVIHITMTTTGGVGELSNFILGVCFVVPAAIIYRIGKKTRKSAFIGAIVGTIVMSVSGIFSNYYIVYPLYYYVMGLSTETIMHMYQAKLPSVTDLWQALAIFNFPLTLAKGAICTAITFLIYKYISPVLHGRK
jgi:riboflavin transporter FmnP